MYCVTGKGRAKVWDKWRGKKKHIFFFAVDQVIIAKDNDYAEYMAKTFKIIIPKMGLKCNYFQSRVFKCRK